MNEQTIQHRGRMVEQSIHRALPENENDIVYDIDDDIKAYKTLPENKVEEKEAIENEGRSRGIDWPRPVMKRKSQENDQLDRWIVFEKEEKGLETYFSICGGEGFEDSYTRSYYSIFGAAVYHYQAPLQSIWSKALYNNPLCPTNDVRPMFENAGTIHNMSFNGDDWGWPTPNKERSLVVWYTYKKGYINAHDVTLNLGAVSAGGGGKIVKSYSDRVISLAVTTQATKRIKFETNNSDSDVNLSYGVRSENGEFIFVLQKNEVFSSQDEIFFYRLDFQGIQGIINASDREESSLSVNEALRKNGDSDLVINVP